MVSVKELTYFFKNRLIFLLGYSSSAGGKAVFDVVVKARSAFSYILGKGFPAGGGIENLLYYFKGVVYLYGGCLAIPL